MSNSEASRLAGVVSSSRKLSKALGLKVACPACQCLAHGAVKDSGERPGHLLRELLEILRELLQPRLGDSLQAACGKNSPAAVFEGIEP